MKNLETMERESRFTTLNTMKENRATLIETFTATRESTPAETVKALVERIGYPAALVTVAEMVNTVSEHDGRIFPSVREWAAGTGEAATREELHKYGLYQPDALHSCHINQMGEAMRDYQPTEEEPAAEMVEVSTLADSLDLGDNADRLNDYRDSDSYICDAISEIADSDTSIYYTDILNFISENPEALADVVAEGLYTVDSSTEYDLYKHGQAAEYMMIERDIYNHLRDAVLLCAVDFIRYDLKRETIPADLADLLQEWADNADNNDRMNDIPDKIREYFKDDEGEDE